MKQWLMVVVRALLIAATGAAVSWLIWAGDYQFHLSVALAYTLGAIVSSHLLSSGVGRLTPARAALSCLISLSCGGGFLGWRLAALGFDGIWPSLVLGSGLGLVIFVLFYLRDDRQVARQQLAEQGRQLAVRDKALVESQLRLLQSQIEPHFLFNTLANLKALIMTDRDRAGELLDHLSQLLRTSLAASREPQRPLADEIAFVRAYLALQQCRLGERLAFSIAVDGPIDLSQPLPPLLLQPLVENAVMHGVEPMAVGGEIRVAVSRDGERLRLSVADNGVGFYGTNSSHGHGVGLANVRQRLAACYGERGRLDVMEREGGGVEAVMEVPCGR